MLRSYGLKFNTDTGLTRDPITGQIVPVVHHHGVQHQNGNVTPVLYHHGVQHQNGNVTPVLYHHGVQHQNGNVTPVLYHHGVQHQNGNVTPVVHHHGVQHQNGNVTPVLYHHGVQHQNGNVTPVLHHQHAISSNKRGSSGVVAFENYKGDQAFMLIKDHKGHSFGYGKRKPGSTSLDTAHAEKFEETCGLFDLRRGLDKNFQLRSCNGSEHSIYVMRVKGPVNEGIQSKYYEHNHSLVHGNQNTPKDYKETSGFTRVYVRDAIAAGALGLQNGTKLCVKDVYGNAVCMCSRDSEYLRDILRKKLNLTVPEHQLTLVKNVFDPSKPFLNGTYRYSI